MDWQRTPISLLVLALCTIATPAFADDTASEVAESEVPASEGAAAVPASEPPASPEPDDDAFAHWRLDAGLTFGHFEQQVKVEIGGAKGEKLVTDSEFGLNLFFTYNPIEYLAVGIFTRSTSARARRGASRGSTRTTRPSRLAISAARTGSSGSVP